jgi:hypothetical protein
MFKTKTHFEQVSLEIVRKIVEEQIRRETAVEQDQGTKKRTLEDLFGGARTFNGGRDLRVYWPRYKPA